MSIENNLDRTAQAIISAAYVRRVIALRRPYPRRVGMLKILGYDHSRNGIWLRCVCDCGKEVIRIATSIRRTVKSRGGFCSCGCKRRNSVGNRSKLCRGCDRKKPLSCFARMNTQKSGYQAKCRPCGKKWRQENRSWLMKQKKKYYREHKVESNIKRKARRHLFREEDNERSRKWARRNRARRREIANKYARSNPARNCFQSNKRRAIKMRAIPKWAKMEEIKKIYEMAKRTGKHVDHIVPLVHPLVCGLHVETNLQLLTPFQNFSKNNRWPWTPK